MSAEQFSLFAAEPEPEPEPERPAPSTEEATSFDADEKLAVALYLDCAPKTPTPLEDDGGPTFSISVPLAVGKSARQVLMFEAEGNAVEADGGEATYTQKIEAPIYEPKYPKPHLLAVRDTTKTNALLREIEASTLPEDEKAFLRLAAHRHTVFDYEKVADYYALASPEMKRLMERSALVIIDFDAAIELGFVRLSTDIEKQFLEEYGGDDSDAE